MLLNTIKKTGLAILTAATLSIGGVSLSTSAQAAPLNLNPIPAELIQADNLLEVRSGHRFKGHNRGFRKFNRGHRSGFRSRGHSRSHFSNGHRKSFKSQRFSRHGSYQGQRSHYRGSARSHLNIFSLNPRSR